MQVQAGQAEKGQQSQAQGDGAEGGEDVVQDRDARLRCQAQERPEVRHTGTQGEGAGCCVVLCARGVTEGLAHQKRARRKERGYTRGGDEREGREVQARRRGAGPERTGQRETTHLLHYYALSCLHSLSLRYAYCVACPQLGVVYLRELTP